MKLFKAGEFKFEICGKMCGKHWTFFERCIISAFKKLLVRYDKITFFMSIEYNFCQQSEFKNCILHFEIN